MSNFDDLFENNTTNATTKDQPFDKAAWAERKRQERTEAFELLDTATVEIAKDPEKFRDFLNTQAQFDRYSVSNAVLIAYQCPGATKVADFSVWKEENVSITKGEKAITIFEPGNEFSREDGTTGVGVNIKKVFDISQTSNSEISMRRRKPEERAVIKALIASSPCEIVMVDQLKNTNAFYSPDKEKIFIVRGLDADDIFRALAYEIGIAKYDAKDLDRKDARFTAYCSAYILCERNGFDTGSFFFDKATEHFTDMDAKTVRKELGAVRNMANEISQDMNRQLEAMGKAKQSKDDIAR